MKTVLKIVPLDFVNESRDLREITTLAENGYEVTVVAKHADGLSFCENNEAYSLIRVNLKPFDINFPSIIKYCIFFFKVLWLGLKYKPKFISAHDLPALIIGYAIKAVRKEKTALLYDSHELTSEMAVLVDQPQWVKKSVEFLEKLLIRRADATMVVCESIAHYDQARYQLKMKPFVVRNIPVSNIGVVKNNYFRAAFPVGDRKILLYQGVIRKGRGLEILIESMKYLDEVCLVILGNGSIDDYYKIVGSNSVEGKVFFHPAVSHSQLLEYTASADVGLCIIENICLSYYLSLPNKLFEYIMAGIPILASNFPEMQKIVEEYQIGETIDPSPINIAEKIKYMIDEDNLGKYEQGLMVAKTDLNWENESKKLLECYRYLEEVIK